MIFLLLSIMCSVSIAHLFKYADDNTLPTFGLLTVNYTVGSVVALLGGGIELLLLWIRQHGNHVSAVLDGSSRLLHKFSAPLIILGTIVGVLFVCNYMLMVLTIKKLGVIIPVSLMRLSAVLPTFGSIIFFSELPRVLQVIGILLAFLSLPLASEERIVLSNLVQVMNNGFGSGLMLFFAFGITNFIFKIQREILPVDNPYHFLMIIFPIAFLVSVSVAIYQKTRITRPILGFGLVLGILNLFSSYFLMKALQCLPGIVVYPTNGIGIILLSVITSVVLWKERLKKINYGFIALAFIALLLIYPR
jgi:drug/metabolite transporter (DMT)-like permease